jgi:transglutaminase-like putative cysteine protease/tetratricopeptide (TPR) repeat protein
VIPSIAEDSQYTSSMLVWRSCIGGRLLAALVAVFGLSQLAWAATDTSDPIEHAREAFRITHGHPEEIAALSALARNDDFIVPGRLEQVLHELVDAKLGGPPDPLVLSHAVYLLSLEEDRRGDFGAAESRRKPLGFLTDFWVLGSFDAQGRSGFGRVFPVEEERQTLDPQAGKHYPGKEREVSWRRAPAEAFVQGAALVDALLRPDNDAVAYLLTYVTSDRDRWAALRLGSSGPIKAWLGGTEVWANDVVRPASLDQDAVPVYLRRGTTLLLIKTVITRGSWRLFARLTDPEGRDLIGVAASANVPARPALAIPNGRRPHPVRDLGKILRDRAEHASGADAAQAWLDEALYLAWVMPADSELKFIETAANKAVPAANTELSSPAIQALLLLGSVAREEDDRRAALERALPALDRPHERAQVLADLGRLARQQHREDVATTRWRQAVALDPRCIPAELALAREEQRAGMTSTALGRLSALPESARSLPLVQDALADVLASLGRHREADALYQSIYNARRSETGAARDLASAARARGDLVGAARIYGEAARWRPELSSLVFDQAAMLEGTGDRRAAEGVLQAALARLPEDPGLHEELGRLQARSGETLAAVASMRRALELRPQNPSLRRYLEALATTNRGKGDARAIDDLVAQYGADGEALAREVLFGPAASDDASAEVLLDRTVVRVHANGLAERFVQRLVHVRSERAARENQETWVRFEPGRQEVEIRKARILRRAASGSIEVSEATGRDERELSEPWYGLYYDSRAEIVTFENLRAGDVVEVQYTVADVAYANELADYFGDFQMIAETLPTRRWDYTLVAPKQRTFYFNQSHFAGLVRETEERGQDTIYRFVAAPVAGVESEPAMPGFAEVAPYLHVSTYRTWDDVGHWYWNLVADQLQDDGTLKKAAVQATAGVTDTLDKVKAIHRLVVENTRYVGLEFGIHGYKPYKSTQVLLRRFGDCKDKATLLVALLRTLGIDSELVLLRTRRGGRIDETPASLAVFDHAIAYVPAFDLYIDGTAEFSGLSELPAEDQDTMALRVSPREIKLVRTPLLPAASNLARRTWTVDLRGDGAAHIAEELSVAGQAAHEWREHYQTPGERMERYSKVWNGRFAGAQLEKVAMAIDDRNQPVYVTAVVTVPHFGESREPGTMDLPLSSREADFTRTYARLGERRWPLVLGYPWHHQEQVTYHLPPGARIVRAPSAHTIASPFGSFTLTVASAADSGGITVKSEIVVDQSRIDRRDYAAFRAFLRDIDAALSERVVVELGRAS